MRRFAWGLLLVLAVALAPTAALAESPAPEPVTLRGRAVELAEALKSRGLAFDAGPVAKQVVLRAEDGTLTPLLSTEESRALFEDARLRGRPVEVRGRRHPGVPYLQVVSFKVEQDGKLRTPEYYCEVCTISVRFPQTCPCCQGDMVLRMKPEAR